MPLVGRKDFRYLALEALVVLFGVLAALLVDRLRADAVVDRAATAAVTRLVAEVRQNRDEISEMATVVEDRLVRLRQLEQESPSGGLAVHLHRFEGYRTPDLNGAAWDRLAGSDLADAVDPELLAEAFYLYQWKRQFEQLDDHINNLIYSETFYLDEKRTVAIAISERIKQQQLTWARNSLPQFDAFLARWDLQH